MLLSQDYSEHKFFDNFFLALNPQNYSRLIMKCFLPSLALGTFKVAFFQVHFHSPLQLLPRVNTSQVRVHVHIITYRGYLCSRKRKMHDFIILRTGSFPAQHPVTATFSVVDPTAVGRHPSEPGCVWGQDCTSADQIYTQLEYVRETRTTLCFLCCEQDSSSHLWLSKKIVTGIFQEGISL